MATEVIRTIRASGGDYTTVAAFNTGEVRDLVDAEEIAVGEVYNDWPTGLTTSNTTLGTGGWTVSASCYIHLRAAPGHRHNGRPRDGSGNFTGAALRMTGANNMLRLSAQYTRVTGLIGENANVSTTYRAAFIAGAANTRVEDCLARCASTNASAAAIDLSTSGTFAVNCATWDTPSLGVRVRGTGGSTALNCSSPGSTIAVQTAASVAINCLAGSFTTTGSVTYSASADGSLSSGTGNRANQTFSFEDAANHDYRLTGADAGARTYGTDLSAYSPLPFSADALGNPRTAPWDIGAFAFVDDGPGDEEASGAGHQTTYAAGSAAQVQPATGGGYQLSAASGLAVQAQPATGSGHQSSYGAGSAEGEVLSPASGAGHQVGYATGVVAASNPASGAGYQTHYATGVAAQAQPASGTGYQASYGIGTAEAAALPSDASGSGYQLSYGTGAATQAQPARGEGYQRTYGAGAAAQAQPASGSGYQQSYGLGSAFTVKAARGSGYQISYARHVVRREDSERPAGGYSYAILNEYDAERQRREAARRARARLKEQAREIEDAVTREIAEHLHAQEEELARQAELDRISALARRHAQAVSEAHEGERVVRAVTRAAIQGNFSALEALERELERLREEEMFLFECLAMVAEYEHAA